MTTPSSASMLTVDCLPVYKSNDKYYLSSFRGVAGNCRLVNLTRYGAARPHQSLQSLKPNVRHIAKPFTGGGDTILTYFGKIDEACIKNNFVLISEVIDDKRLFGYSQNSEIDTLKTSITTESIVSSAIAAEESSKITAQATGATSWRRGDVKYKKNDSEAFVDVVETVAKGTVLHADVDGHI
ncbi:hypothetical protein BDZ89DRAFT_1040033 [Hymenopellis radicata]|nr:hypothetical protein BDZ89DRAFT_1040033 [Hymenopellis radicata]